MLPPRDSKLGQLMGVGGAIADTVAKQGWIDFKPDGTFKTWKNRYVVVKRNGVVDIYEKEESTKRKFGFQLQGGETLEIKKSKAHKQKFPFAIVDLDSEEYSFSAATESVRNDWVKTIRGILKQLDALIALHTTVNSVDHSSKDGRLKIAQTLATCGHLAKARREFDKLREEYDDDIGVQQSYESFLVDSLSDIYRAEANFVRRLKFLCVPKSFLTAREGTQLLQICHQVSFFATSQDEQKSNAYYHAMPQSYAAGMNLENEWPFNLYATQPGHWQEATQLVTKWLSNSQQQHIPQMEYTFEELEKRCWKIMRECIRDQKNVARLRFRLDEVDKSKESKVDRSNKNRALPSSNHKKSTTLQVQHNLKREDTFSAMGSEMIDDLLDDLDFASDPGRRSSAPLPASIPHPGPRITELDGHSTGTPLISESHVDKHIDNIDFGEFGSPSDSQQYYMAEPHPISGSGGRPNDPFNRKNKFKMLAQSQPAEHFNKNRLGIGAGMGLIGGMSMPAAPVSNNNNRMDLIGGMSLPGGVGRQGGMNLIGARSMPPSALGKVMENSKASPKNVRGESFDTDLKYLAHASGILQDPDNHFFPWTAFMLVWMTRRDHMEHIGGHQEHESHIRAVLEFVYLFARGCFEHLQDCLPYRGLLAAIAEVSNNNDPEDVKYKMYVQAVTVISDPRVKYLDKKAVFDFIFEQRWHEKVSKENKAQKIALSKFYQKGFRNEIERIYVELDDFYKRFLFGTATYDEICRYGDKNHVSEVITRQDDEKVQGRPTWGPRSNNTYDKAAFELVCNHRTITNVPIPEKNPSDFDAAYLCFLIALAHKLKPHFYATVRNVMQSIRASVHDLPQKDFLQGYHRVRGELSQHGSPRAARMLDLCRCEVSFPDMFSLMNGFEALKKCFRICKIVNKFPQQSYVAFNVRFISVFVLCYHPTNRFIKLICEVRLTLDTIRKLNNQRRELKDCFDVVLTPKEATRLVKEYMRKLVADTHAGTLPSMATFY